MSRDGARAASCTQGTAGTTGRLSGARRSTSWLSTWRALLGPLCATALSCVLGCTAQPAEADPPPLVQGVVWQVDNSHIDVHGDWAKLGVTDLLVQWTAVDGTAFVATPDLPELTAAPRFPDWPRIGREPWARDVIVGLSGRFDENSARAQAIQLVEQSAKLAKYGPPVHITGWYFPVEIDPTWYDAKTLRSVLAALPRPLWISVYDRANVGGKTLADWLATWLPPDVGVFFQDGCGVYARTAPVAREYADALSARLGSNRVRIIAEAFRPAEGGGFRPATAEELLPQLANYHGYRTYLFDGPHYVSDELVKDLLKQASIKPPPAPAEPPASAAAPR